MNPYFTLEDLQWWVDNFHLKYNLVCVGLIMCPDTRRYYQGLLKLAGEPADEDFTDPDISGVLECGEVGFYLDTPSIVMFRFPTTRP